MNKLHGLIAATHTPFHQLGVDVGPARLPNGNLDAAQVAQLRGELEALGFFDWIQKS